MKYPASRFCRDTAHACAAGLLSAVAALLLVIPSALTVAIGSDQPPVGRKVVSTDAMTLALCKKVASLVKSESIRQYHLNMVDVSDSPRTSKYLNLDIDKDGVSDEVRVSSGSAGSFLEILLSSGGEIELEAGFMTLLKLENQVYALATYWDLQRKDPQLTGRRLYLVNKLGTKLVCDTKDF